MISRGAARLAEPCIEVAERAAREGALPLQRLCRAAEAVAVRIADRLVDRRKQAEVDVHRLKVARPSPGTREPARDVREQRAMRGREWRQDFAQPQGFGCGEAGGHKSDRGRLRRSPRSR